MLRDLYEAKIKGQRDNATMLHIGLAKARKKGLAERRSKGLEQGREQGARDSIIALASKMVKEKFSFTKIEELTGLSLAEIEQIANRH